MVAIATSRLFAWIGDQREKKTTLPVGCADLAADTLMGVKFDKSYSREARRHWPGIHREQ
jgi:hypothetical protein